MKYVLAVLVVCATLFGVFVYIVLGTTTVVERGAHGPFTIGEDKAVSAQTLRQLGLWPPRAIAPHRPWLDSPDFAELERVFGADEGIMVGFGVASSVPTRLEFEGDTLVAYWPVETPKTWSNPNPGYDEADEAILAFQDRIAIGMSRENVFRSVAQSGQEIGTAVRGHVVGAQRYRPVPLDELAADSEYSDFVMSKSSWEFDGLKSAVWYSLLKEPYYSRVRLYFEDDKLVRVEHWHGPLRIT